MKRLRTWKLFQIFSTNIKKSKTYIGLCAFKGLSNGTTLMQIQSGRTVHLRLKITEKTTHLGGTAKALPGATAGGRQGQPIILQIQGRPGLEIHLSASCSLASKQ
jgi:hypothetical protein